jgi:hypothetical protein
MIAFNQPYQYHGEAPKIDDAVNYLRAALENVGHICNISPFFDKRAVNIVIEYFPDEAVEAIGDQIKSGTRFIVVAPEIVTGSTFNDFGVAEEDQSSYSNSHRSVWDWRFKNFLKVAEMCRCVWCFTPQQLEGYTTVIPRSWLRLIPIGFVEGYASAELRPDREKDIDFLFSGTITSRRNRILQHFDVPGIRVLRLLIQTPDFVRDNAAARAKISLGIKHFDEWKYPSLLRHYYHLMNQSIIVSEACPIPCILDPFTIVIDPDRFVPGCFEELRSGNFAERAKANLQRFRDEYPLAPLFRELLDQSL